MMQNYQILFNFTNEQKYSVSISQPFFCPVSSIVLECKVRRIKIFLVLLGARLCFVLIVR